MEKRNFNLDLIRSFAVYCVLSIHFFAHTAYYDKIIVGTRMYIETMFRTCFMTGVPLFLILSGYLMNKKRISKKYFFALSKNLIPYVISMLCITIYQVMRGEAHNIVTFLKDIFSFSYYSWYIEMYIGLYLIIPFLNIIYSNLESKRQKHILLGICILLTTVPTLLNAFDNMIFPDWWQGYYPVTYYFVGVYLAEYKDEIGINLKLNLLFLIISVLITSGFCYYRSYNNVFNWGDWCSEGGAMNLPNAVLIFLFLLRISVISIPKWTTNLIGLIAKVSLPLYLVSYILDSRWYPILNSHVTLDEKIFYYPLSIMVTFIGSFVLACGVEKISTIIYGWISGMIKNYL